MPLRSLTVFVAFTTATLGVFLVRPENPRASETASPSLDIVSSPHSLILQEGDGEHLLRRPKGQTAAASAGSIPEFIIKIDKQNGGAEDFVALTEDLKPGAIIPFHKHHKWRGGAYPGGRWSHGNGWR